MTSIYQKNVPSVSGMRFCFFFQILLDCGKFYLKLSQFEQVDESASVTDILLAVASGRQS